jgi:dTDP-4-dehydrorhamnose reductase
MRELAIVGANGFIGRNINSYLVSKGHTPVLISHMEGYDYLFASEDDIEFLVTSLPKSARYVLICTGYSNIDGCLRNPEKAERLNFQLPLRIAQSCWRSGRTPILISSDLVFGHGEGPRREEEEVAPTSRYGYWKARAEESFLGAAGPAIVVRLTKVYSHQQGDTSPIINWIDAWKQGTTVRCVTDQMLQPTHVSDIGRVLEKLMGCKAEGLWHVAGDEMDSRYGMACYIAGLVSASTELIASCRLEDLGLIELRPSNTTLDNSKVCQQLGVNFTPLSSFFSVGHSY